MSAPFIASTASPRPAPRLVALALATLVPIVVALGAVSLGAWHPWSVSNSAQVQNHYGAGYPLHGGLAGPSRISVFDQYPGYGPGYPLHGGLAGPSRVQTVEHPGYGQGYPLHGGLAGPSQVGGGE